MQRYRQTVDDLLQALSIIESSWRDEHSEAVLRLIEGIPEKRKYRLKDVQQILDADFDAGLTTIRLVLELSKDEFTIAVRDAIGVGGAGVTRYRQDRDVFLQAIARLGFLDAVEQLVGGRVSWRHILIERLKLGRGSAIRGQARGRRVENFVEVIVKRIASPSSATCCEEARGEFR